MQNKNLGGFIPLIHLLWYLDKYVCIFPTVGMLIQWLLWMTRLPWPQRLQWRTSRGGLKWRFWLCQRSTKTALVRECNWAGENNGTGSRAQEVLQLSLCLLRRLHRGPCDTVLKYERTIMCTLLYNSKWHQDLRGRAHSEEFGEGMMS